MAYSFNATAQDFDPNGGPKTKAVTPPQVTTHASPYLEERLLGLEAAQTDLHNKVESLKTLYHELHGAVGEINRQPWQDIVKHHESESAAHFACELERLSEDVRVSLIGEVNEQKLNDDISSHTKATSATGSDRSSAPPLLSGKLVRTVAGHSVNPLSMDRTKHRHDPLATDGPIDTIVRIMPAAAPSPPSSPATAQYDLPVGNLEDFSLSKWTPHYLTTLPSLSSDIRSKIPPQQNFTTFTYDFLQNTFGGMAWSPGLRYINSTTSVPLVENRTYYLLDPEHEPYLPKAPGEHGAKLTAFFNKAPEEVFECDGHAEGTNSYTNVPMFIHVSKGRYAYFGHYSQTRWSDRLDNDTMQARVSQDVKQHVANELAATPREPWVTRELKLHFFPVPKYEGTIPTPKTRDDTTNNTREEEKHNKQVAKDISGYIQELAEWEREASMKTAMIKADFILNALDAADADDPPALRLWWEYLQCVDWKPDFYGMLVGLQARHNNPK